MSLYLTFVCFDRPQFRIAYLYLFSFYLLESVAVHGAVTSETEAAPEYLDSDEEDLDDDLDI